MKLNGLTMKLTRLLKRFSGHCDAMDLLDANIKATHDISDGFSEVTSTITRMRGVERRQSAMQAIPERRRARKA